MILLLTFVAGAGSYWFMSVYYSNIQEFCEMDGTLWDFEIESIYTPEIGHHFISGLFFEELLTIYAILVEENYKADGKKN